MVDRGRYRVTRAAFDVISVFGALEATALPGPVLVAVLAEYGYSTSSVRNQLTRMVSRGVLQVEHQGRIGVYRRADMLDEQFNTFAGRGRAPKWDGHFDAILYNIPETDRGARDRLLYTAERNQYHLLRPGVLIGHHNRFDDVAHVVGRLSDPSWYLPATLRPDTHDDARRMADVAFELPRARERVEICRAAVDRVLARGGRLTIAEFFDAFHRVAQELAVAPHPPAELLAGRPPAAALGELLGVLRHVYGERLATGVRQIAMEQSCAGLIEWESSVGDPLQDD